MAHTELMLRTRDRDKAGSPIAWHGDPNLDVRPRCKGTYTLNVPVNRLNSESSSKTTRRKNRHGRPCCVRMRILRAAAQATRRLKPASRTAWQVNVTCPLRQRELHPRLGPSARARRHASAPSAPRRSARQRARRRISSVSLDRRLSRRRTLWSPPTFVLVFTTSAQ